MNPPISPTPDVAAERQQPRSGLGQRPGDPGWPPQGWRGSRRSPGSRSGGQDALPVPAGEAEGLAEEQKHQQDQDRRTQGQQPAAAAARQGERERETIFSSCDLSRFPPTRIAPSISESCRCWTNGAHQLFAPLHCRVASWRTFCTTRSVRDLNKILHLTDFYMTCIQMTIRYTCTKELPYWLHRLLP